MSFSRVLSVGTDQGMQIRPGKLACQFHECLCCSLGQHFPQAGVADKDARPRDWGEGHSRLEFWLHHRFKNTQSLIGHKTDEHKLSRC